MTNGARGRGRPGGIKPEEINQLDSPANPDNRAIENTGKIPDLVNWKHVNTALRMRRAADLAECIALADPEDARPLMTAALIDLHAGMPQSEALDPSAAQDWAKHAGEAELVAMAEAVEAELQGRALHLDQRKGLLRTLFSSLPFENRLRFLHWGQVSLA